MAGNRFGKTFAGPAVGARNRDQILHGRLGADFSIADVLLDALGQLAHQRQAARDPRHAAVEPPGKIVQAQTQAAMKFGKQPSLFERRFSFRRAQGPVQNQRFGFIHVPHGRAHRVPAQTLQGSNPFVAVNDQEPVRLVRQGDNHNRNLLASFGERSQQTPFALRPADPKRFVTQIQLVKLQFHADFLLAAVSDDLAAAFMPVRDTLSTVRWLYLCSDKHLPTEAGA